MATNYLSQQESLNESKASGSLADLTAFYTLLDSLSIGSAQVEKLAKPVLEAMEQERRRLYRRRSLVMMVVMIVLALMFLAIFITIAPYKEEDYLVFMVLYAFLGGVGLLAIWALFSISKRTGEVRDSRDLLFLRLQVEGSMAKMLGEMSSGTVVAKDAEEIYGKPLKSFSLLGPWTAKVTLLIYVLVLAVYGAAYARATGAFYAYATEGVVLTHWASSGGTVTIPSEVDGMPVTDIATLVFENRTDIVRVIVPATVTTIESGAFRGCTNLQEVVLPDTLTTLGAEAFWGCTSLERFTVPAGVTELRADAFRGCTALKEVTLHEGVTSIRARAFCGCSSLTGVELPQGLTMISPSAFEGCSSLTSIEIPAPVQEIGAWAFFGCSKLAQVTFQSEMQGGKIGEGAFRGCTSLTKFAVPKGVTKISAQAFYGCTALTEITMPEVLEEKKISESTFYGCKSLRSIVIPEGVTTISAHAFHYCTSLSEVKAPQTLKDIGSSAFRDCKSLKEIALPKGCWVDTNSFKDSPTKRKELLATSQYSVKNGQATLVKWGGAEAKDPAAAVIPADYQGVPVVAIGKEAFSGRKELQEVVLPATIQSIGANAFYGCTWLERINLPEGLTTIGDGAFYGCAALASITIPASVTSIGIDAFCYADLSQGVTLPETVETLLIADGAFGGTRLKEIMLPAGLTEVDGFNDCAELVAVGIPGTVTTIGTAAFSGCEKLMVVQIAPGGLVKIGAEAFARCTALETITLSADCEIAVSAFRGSPTRIQYHPAADEQ